MTLPFPAPFTWKATSDTVNLMHLSGNKRMNKITILYKRHRLPPRIIQYAAWLYDRFSLSHRDIEDLWGQRGITLSYESILQWCNKFGPTYAKRLKKLHQGIGDTFYINEVFVNIGGKKQY